MADDDKKEEATEDSGGGKGKLIAMVGGVALLAAGAGFGAATFLGGSSDTTPVAEEDPLAELEDPIDDEGGSKEPDGPGRIVVPLKPFTVNLRGGGGGRMLRLEVQVEVAKRHEEAIEAKKPVLRDAVLTLVSDQTYADLEGLDGKTHLRDALLRRLNGVLDDIRIQRIYFTDFVVQ